MVMKELIRFDEETQRTFLKEVKALQLSSPSLVSSSKLSFQFSVLLKASQFHISVPLPTDSTIPFWFLYASLLSSHFLHKTCAVC